MGNKSSAINEEDDGTITVLKGLNDSQTTTTKINLSDDMESQDMEDIDFQKYPLPEKMTCADKFLYLVCCHGCGCTCCRRRTKARRYAKTFFKTFSVG